MLPALENEKQSDPADPLSEFLANVAVVVRQLLKLLSLC